MPTSSPEKPPEPDPFASISAGVPVVESKDSPNEIDKREERDLQKRKSKADIRALEESNFDRRANRVLRFRYAKNVYKYLCCYSIGCALLLILAGFKLGGFSLPDVVLTALTGSTAASAIGLVGFVVSGLFKNN